MGRLEMASNGNGTYDFEYDALGRITRVEGPYSVWLEFTYDDQGNRTLVEDSFLGSETSTYDGAQRLLSRVFTQTGGPTLRVDQEFDLAGRLIGKTRTNDTTPVGSSVFGHDGAGRITALDHLDANDDPLVEYVFTYDGAGQLLSQSDHGDLREYAYDDQGQLTDDDQGNQFDYDALGNREGADYEYDLVHQNQLTSDGVWDYTYDDEGNLRKKVKILDGDPDEDKTWIYGYDHKNQLISAELWELDPDYYNPGPTGPAVLRDVEYKYDVFGSRIEKSVDLDGEGQDPAEVTRYAIDRWNPAKPAPIGNENADVWAELNEDGTLRTRYIRSDVVDQLFAHIDDSGAAFWYLADHLGSIRDVTNMSGAIVETLGYDGFGNINSIKDGNGNLIPDAEYVGSYRYTGREFDVETGLQYNRGRYYDAMSGRWISQDPIGFDAGDSNLYRYVNNRPTIDVDPSGLDSPTRASMLAPRPSAAASVPIPKSANQILMEVVKTAPRFVYVKSLDTFMSHKELKDRYDDQADGRVRDPIYAEVNILGGTIKKVTDYKAPRITDKRIAFENEVSPLLNELYAKAKDFYNKEYSKTFDRLSKTHDPRVLTSLDWSVRLDIKARTGMDEPTAPHAPANPAREALLGLLEVVGGFIPGVGETQDLSVITDPNMPWLARAIAGGSLLLSAITGGLSPNAGGFFRGADNLVGGLARQGDEIVEGIVRQADGFARMALDMVPANACFVAGTPLLTPDGDKPIDEFRVGDLILSRAEDDPNGPLEVKQVEEVFVRVAPLLNIRVRDREIRTTGEHPFYARERGWITAKELQAGDELLSHDGEWIALDYRVISLRRDVRAQSP